MIYDVIIFGAGAAGLMCACEAGKRGRSVLVLEHNEKAGEKIRISGGGRCNFTNISVTSGKFYFTERELLQIGACAIYTGGFCSAYRMSRD